MFSPAPLSFGFTLQSREVEVEEPRTVASPGSTFILGGERNKSLYEHCCHILVAVGGAEDTRIYVNHTVVCWTVRQTKIRRPLINTYNQNS